MNNNKFKIADLGEKLNLLVKKTCDLLEQTENKSEKDKLLSELAELRNRMEVRIAFVGQYSSGKSTIISALSGNKNIKIDANVSTDIVEEYRWNNIILMDTPGILAGKREQHDTRTKEALKECDLVVYVLTSQLFDDVIFENFIDLAYNQKLNDKLLIAINKMSMEKGFFEDLVINYTSSIKKMFADRGYEFTFEVVFIDAADYLEGSAEGDDEFIQLSNFNTFISTLNSFVEKKGLIKKQFDTPVRILKSKVSDIALSATDPKLKDIFSQFTTRIVKSMRDVQRSVLLALNRFEEKVISDSYQVCLLIGESDKNELKTAHDNFSRSLQESLFKITKEIEQEIETEYNTLMSSMDEFANKDAVVIFSKNIEIRINAPGISIEEKVNLEKQKKFLDYAKQGGSKLSSMSSNGIEGIKGLSSASGSQMHTVVKEVGHFFGHKFKPWEAVKVTSRFAKLGKYGLPAITALTSLGLDIYQNEKEKQRLKEISAAKMQYTAGVRNAINQLHSQIEQEFSSNVLSNYRNKLEEINALKMDLSKSMEQNEKIRKTIKELDAEYIDFIEIVEEV